MKESTDMDKTRRIRELTELLDRAARAYYQESNEIMPNKEYDRLYDELLELEKETGIVMAGSPTQKVGYEVLSQLPKEQHPSRMLSLDKTKSRDELAEWLGEQEGILSWKLDGLTVELTYEGGELAKAVTRGNGEIGEVITGNAKTFVNIPLRIAHKGRLVLRGEAVISYKEFERINQEIEDEGAKYKNPRNLCSGSVRQLDPAVTKSRRVSFIAFSLVEAEGKEFSFRAEEFDWLASQGFDVVERRLTDGGRVREDVEYFASRIEGNAFPSDGLVLSFNDIAYGKSLGETAKYPRDSIAFKWSDQTEETTLREVEWSASRTGLINPVAVFDPVELEGTTVSRASVHNVSIVRELKLGIGDRITVYKANMIIPQISENLTASGSLPIPEVCPVCGGKTEIRSENGVETLFCPNEECQAKQIKGFSLFVSRNAMNIEGVSEKVLEKLIDLGIVKEYADLYRLEESRERIITMEGFGEKSFENMQSSIEKSRKTSPERLLFALGVPNIGEANARMIAKAAGQDWNKIEAMTEEELTAVPGVGSVMAEAYTRWFRNEKNLAVLHRLLPYLEIKGEETGGDAFLEGLTFVITGSLTGYENRGQLKKLLEGAGARVAGSVSSNTSYLINNNVNSTSGKNKDAKKLGIPIVPESFISEWLRSGVKPEEDA